MSESGMVLLGTTLARCDGGDADVEMWAADADDGAVTIIARYRPDAIDAHAWHCSLYLHREQESGAKSAHLVASAFGRTRESAERALTSELAALIGIARVPRSRVA